MTIKSRWIDKTGGRLLVEVNKNHRFEVTLEGEGRDYFAEAGCTCKPVLLYPHEDYKVMVGGVDDCPVHGVYGKH